MKVQDIHMATVTRRISYEEFVRLPHADQQGVYIQLDGKSLIFGSFSDRGAKFVGRDGTFDVRIEALKEKDIELYLEKKDYVIDDDVFTGPVGAITLNDGKVIFKYMGEEHAVYDVYASNGKWLTMCPSFNEVQEMIIMVGIKS